MASLTPPVLYFLPFPCSLMQCPPAFAHPLTQPTDTPRIWFVPSPKRMFAGEAMNRLFAPLQVRQALESISRYAVGQQPSGPQQQPDPQLMIVVRAALAQLLRRSARYIRDRGLSQMETLVTSLEQGPALTQQGGIEPAVSSLHSLSRILGAVGLLLLDLARLAGQVHGFQAGDMGPLLRASPSNARPFQVAMEAGALGGRQQQPQVRVHLQMAGPSGRAGPARFVRSPMSADEQQHQSVQQPTAQQPQDVPEGLEEMLTRLLPGMMERAVTSALQQHQLQAASTPPPSSASSSRSPQAVHSTAQAQPQQIAGGVPPPSNQLTSEAASGEGCMQTDPVAIWCCSLGMPGGNGLGAGLDWHGDLAIWRHVCVGSRPVKEGLWEWQEGL